MHARAPWPNTVEQACSMFAGRAKNQPNEKSSALCRSAGPWSAPSGVMPPTTAKLRAIFGVFDTDGSGAIDVDEMHVALAKGGKSISRDEAAEILAQVDADNDGQISFEEFQTAFRAMSTKPTGAPIFTKSLFFDSQPIRRNAHFAKATYSRSSALRRETMKSPRKQSQRNSKDAAVPVPPLSSIGGAGGSKRLASSQSTSRPADGASSSSQRVTFYDDNVGRQSRYIVTMQCTPR